MPLSHLITLIINAHRNCHHRVPRQEALQQTKVAPAGCAILPVIIDFSLHGFGAMQTVIRKTSLLQDRTDGAAKLANKIISATRTR